MRNTSAFVGRTEEYNYLYGQVALPATATFILGAPGMGKSRLVREVVESHRDCDTFTGVSWQGNTATPYFPWIQIIGAASRLVDPDSEEYAGRAQDLAPLLPGKDKTSRFSDDHIARDLLGIGVVNYLKAVALKARCLTLVIEDVHAADPDSIELATWVVRQQLPLSVVITSRPYEGVTPELQKPLDALAAECSTIALEGLGVSHVEDLLLDQGMGDLDVSEAQLLTQGNPLALHNLVDSRRSLTGASYRSTSDFRLHELEAPSLALMQFAALVGNEFDIATIADAVRSKPAEALELLQAPLDLGLVRRVGQTLTRFIFDHETVREEIVELIGATQRGHLHQRLLEVFLARNSPAEQDVVTLAHHASFAAFVGDASLAVDLNLQAGDSALAHSAPSMARRHFDRAIELAELAGSSTAVRIRAEMGSVRAIKAEASPDFERSITTLLNRVSEPSVSPGDFVDATLLLPSNWSSLAVSPEPDQRTVVWLERALERVGEAPTTRRAQVLIELSIHQRQSQSGDGIEATRAMADEALQIAQESGDVRLEAYIYASMQWLSRTPGSIETILAKIDDYESRIGGGGDEALVLSGVRVTTLLRSGAFDLARRELDRLEWTLSPMPPFVAWAIGRWHATLMIVRGDYVGGEAAANAAFEHAKDSAFAGVAFEYLAIQLAVVLRDRVQMEAAEPMIAEMVRTRPDYGAYRAAYAWLLNDLGRKNEARRQLAQLFSRRTLWSDEILVEWMPLAAMAATAAAELGEVEWCEECVALLEPFKDEWIVWGTGIAVDGPVRLRRAYAALVAGDLETATADLLVARQQIVGSAARSFLPVLLHHEARLAQSTGDLVSAVDLATRASDAAADIHLQGAAEVLAALAFELAALLPADPDCPAVGVEQPVPSTNHQKRKLRGSLIRKGSSWTLELGDDTSTIVNVKGLLALAALLDRPGREIHVAELSSVIDGNSRGHAANKEMASGEATDVLLDDQAIREYRNRISALEEELEEARSFNDLERESRAQLELDFIMDELRVSTGLGGRSRSTTSSVERARVRVTKSLRTAISRVADASPVVGNHLSNSVQTGTYCSYQPDGLNDISWEVSTGGG